MEGPSQQIVRDLQATRSIELLVSEVKAKFFEDVAR